MPKNLVNHIISALIIAAAVLGSAGGQAQDRQPQLMENKKTLFKRVIVRPGAELAASPGAHGQPVPAFNVYYVYGTRGDYVEVGSAIGRADGFVGKDKVIEWKQTIVATFTNTANRQRSLLFRSREAIEDVVRDRDPAQRLMRLRTAASRGESGDNSPILAIEPETLPDFRQKFYFLPILSEKPARLTFDHEGSILEVASLTLQPPDRPQAAAAQPFDRAQALRNFKVGVVFVIDTTVTMGPYIEQVRQTMVELKRKLEQSSASENLRFGLIGFRQSLQNNPAGVEYHIKTFLRLDRNATAAEFVRAIGNVKQSAVPTQGWDEDSLGGVFEAIRGSDWQEFQARFVVLVSDAGPLRQSGDPRFSYAQGLGSEEINAKAVEQNISVFVLHMLTPEGRFDHGYAASQYSALARFGAGKSGYFGVPNGDPVVFRRELDRFAGAISANIAAAQDALSPAPPPSSPGQDGVTDAVRQNIYAMKLAYLGSREGTRPPPMFQAYISTVDLATAGLPPREAVEVRVFLTKNQLSSMYNAIRLIISAAEERILDANKFFEKVRAGILILARGDPSRQMGDTLGSAMGEFLEGLPFSQMSDVLSLTETGWRDLSGDAQGLLMARLGRKMRFMEDWHNTPGNWVKLTPNVPDGEAVTAFPMRQLP